MSYLQYDKEKIDKSSPRSAQNKKEGPTSDLTPSFFFAEGMGEDCKQEATEVELVIGLEQERGELFKKSDGNRR